MPELYTQSGLRVQLKDNKRNEGFSFMNILFEDINLHSKALEQSDCIAFRRFQDNQLNLKLNICFTKISRIGAR